MWYKKKYMPLRLTALLLKICFYRFYFSYIILTILCFFCLFVFVTAFQNFILFEFCFTAYPRKYSVGHTDVPQTCISCSSVVLLFLLLFFISLKNSSTMCLALSPRGSYSKINFMYFLPKLVFFSSYPHFIYWCIVKN